MRAIVHRREELHARKQEVVRQQIWNSAIELFYSDGFDSVTVEQIAESAGISRRTFFRYFSSKEDILASSVRSYVTTLAETITADNSDSTAIEVCRRAIPAALEPCLPSAERVMQIAMQSVSARSAHVHQGPFVQEMLTNAFAVRAHRPGRPELEDRVLAHLVLFTTSLCVEMWIEQSSRPLPDIVDEVLSTFTAVSTPCADTLQRIWRTSALDRQSTDKEDS